MNLILKPTGSHYGTDWGENDYVVLCNREVVGRVMLHRQTSKEEPWFWTITAQRQPPSPENHGYSDTREAAMDLDLALFGAGHPISIANFMSRQVN